MLKLYPDLQVYRINRGVTRRRIIIGFLALSGKIKQNKMQIINKNIAVNNQKTIRDKRNDNTTGGRACGQRQWAANYESLG